MSDKIFAGGLSLDFFVEKDFESLKDLTDKAKEKANARNLIRLLMLEQVVGWRQAINLKTMKFAFYDASLHEREFMLNALQKGLRHIGKQLKEKDLDEQQKRQVDILISSILSYVPFAYPVKNTEFEVPQFIDGQWQLIPYRIIPIELSVGRSNIPLIFNDNDRIWAYGLAPQRDDKDVSPWLIYQGTTYPSGYGFSTSLMTDMRPFRTVGHDLFVMGKPELEKWFELYPNNNMRVTGVSLGGSLSLLTACCFGDRCRQIIALNPAGLYENSALAEIDHWDTFLDKPEVQVIKQGADPVSLFGTWKPDWTILRGEVIEKCPNFWTHHFVNFAGSRHTRFIEEPNDYDKRIRTYNNLFWYTGNRAVIYTLFLLPWRYLILPLYRLASAALFAAYVLAKAFLTTLVSLITKLVMALMKGVSMMANGIAVIASNACHSVRLGPSLDTADDENQSNDYDKYPKI